MMCVWVCGYGKRWFCLTSVCLSVAYIGPNSRTEKPRKIKIGTEVAHVTRDSDITFTCVGCVCVCVCGRVARMCLYPWSEWLETWRGISPRHCIAACWFWQAYVLGLKLAFGFRVRLRKSAPVCISTKCTYLLVDNAVTFSVFSQGELDA